MNTTEIIGLVATLLTTSAFFPEVKKAYMNKNNLPTSTLIIFIIGNIFWIGYGILMKGNILITSSVINLIIQLFLVYSTFKSKRELKIYTKKMLDSLDVQQC